MPEIKIDPLTGAPVVESPSDFVAPSTAELPVVETPQHLSSRAEFLKAIEDVVRRYTSDTQSFQKCMAELTTLVPE